jgi:3-methyl-2-oxobutanoate hydroxymethyltransferase
MSATSKFGNSRVSVPDIRARKGGEPVVCLTAYTAPMAQRLDEHVDLLLVGDSVGMVLYGMDTTLGVDLDMMIRHGKAVVRASSHALIVIDMPFGSYEESPQQAFANCARALAETGAQAIKLEGGREMADTVSFLTKRGIPVMAHVGLTPQSVHSLGGFKAQGRERKDWDRIIEDAKSVASAGAFATVLEGVAEPLAVKITSEVPNITIGIGASAQCDGQIVVSEDMLGFHGWVPRFVRTYANIADVIGSAAEEYAKDVRARTFPGEENTFSMKKK